MSKTRNGIGFGYRTGMASKGSKLNQIPKFLLDGNGRGWFDWSFTDLISKDGSNYIAEISSRDDSGVKLIQSTQAKKPLLFPAEIHLDGNDDGMQSAAIADLVQPTTIYMVVRQKLWIQYDRIIDGLTSNTAALSQVASVESVSPKLSFYAGAYSGSTSDMELNRFRIIRIVANGANSKMQVDELDPITGNFGAANMGGITLGFRPVNNDRFAKIGVKEMIFRNVADSEIDQTKVIEYLKTHNPSVAFSDEKTIIPYEVGKHYGFASLIFVNARLYCFYRSATKHTSYDGVCKSIYSDDNGATWSLPVETYTGAEILIDHPEILTGDPLATTDVRDLRTIILPDGNLGLFGFVAAGHNVNTDDRVNAAFYSFCISIPISGSNLDLDNKEISYIAATPYAGGLTIKNGIIYASCYSGTDTTLYKSADNGATWESVSVMFTTETNEQTMQFIGNVLYSISRTNAEAYNHRVAKSTDYGETWTEATIIKNIGGPASIVIGNKILVFGRSQGNNEIIAYYLKDDLSIYGNEIGIKVPFGGDCAYGNIVLKNGVYYFLYANGPINSDPNTYSSSSTGLYFKTIPTKYLTRYF